MSTTPDPLAQPASGVRVQAKVGAHMTAAAASPKATLSVREVKFDTALSHITADVMNTGTNSPEY
jgi:hypothetical protein